MCGEDLKFVSLFHPLSRASSVFFEPGAAISVVASCCYPSLDGFWFAACVARCRAERSPSFVYTYPYPCAFRYQRLCGLLERHGRRDDLLYALLGACGLPERLSVVAPARATDIHLRAYHDRDYIEVQTTWLPLSHRWSSPEETYLVARAFRAFRISRGLLVEC